MALFPITRRKITVRAMPRFPARVSASGGVSVVKSNGEYAFTLDFTSVTQIAELEADDSLIVQRADDSLAYITSDAAGLFEFGVVTDYISGLIPTPGDGDYKLIVKLPYAVTITNTTTISASGTCTATFKIDGAALGGTANSVSSSEDSQAHASSNSAAAGTDISLTISANSSCADLSFTITYTRTL